MVHDELFALKLERLLLGLALLAFFFFATRGRYWLQRTSGIRRLNASRFLQRWTPQYTQLLLLILFALAIVARKPGLFVDPRFWAEEGTTWFQFGLYHSWSRTLFYVYRTSGYLNLTANLGGVLSSLTADKFGIVHAPLATTILAFLIQLFALALILFGRSSLFDCFWKRLTGCLIVVFAPTDQGEVWLNSINAMSFLGLICLFLVFEQTWTWPRMMRWVSRTVIVVCGLSSPYAIALLPLHLLYALKTKMREQKIQAALLSLCMLVQILVVIRVRVHHERTIRVSEARLDTSMIDVFTGDMARPILGESTRDLLIEKLGLQEALSFASAFPPRRPANSVLLAGWFCFILAAFVIWKLRSPAQFGTTNWLILAFLILCAFTCLSSVHGVTTGRYAFLPGIVFLFVVMNNIQASRSRVIRAVSALVLSYGLADGMVTYHGLNQFGPSWSREVQLWRADHTHQLLVWPPGWSGVEYHPAPAR